MFNSARRTNLDKAEELTREIFFKNSDNLTKGNNIGSFNDTECDSSWKSKIKMCKTFMFYQTLRAFIWKNVYSNTQSMFDVSGENQEADNESNKQKAALVDVFEKMTYQHTCDKVIEYALLHGELITFCSWKKKTEQYRKKIEKEDLLNPAALAAIGNGKFHYIAERPIFDNPYIYAVNPANFVFDVSQKDNWEDCPKILKSYKNPNDIINNKYYKVSKDVAQEIKALVKSSDNTTSQMDKDLENETANGRTIEVLEHWGNLTLKDGTVLKNWHAVVVARKYLVRFCKNNRIINPFTFGTFITDPETKRGIPPLYCVLSLALMQENLMNRTYDMQSLNEDPPIYAPKGFFQEKEIKLYPGKIIEFGDDLNPANIKPMEFNSNIFLNDISFISDLMAETSGIFPNMAGADENRAKTATEISTKTQGQLTRLSQMIDTINQGMIIPDVKNVAKLCADFKTGNENILVDKGSEKETITITDEIRQGDYRYTYSDRTATTERSNKADLMIQAAERFAKFIPLNAAELFTWYMEQKGVENPERFLQLQQSISPEVQQALMNNPDLAPVIQAMEQQAALNKEQQLKSNGKNDVIPDSTIPQAVPME